MLEGAPAHPGRRALRLALGLLILLNVAAVVIESIDSVRAAHAAAFWRFELFSVVVFMVEYGLRLWSCVEDPRYAGPFGRLRFAVTPLALIDLVAILPFLLTPFVALDMRVLRSLRLLRIFKLSRHSSSLELLLTVIRKEAASVMSAMFVMFIVILLAASGMYSIERNAQSELDTIPKAIWWAAVTLTTVGYGDVVPITVAGKIFGLVITFAGVGMVALPAGILASGFSLELQRRREVFRLHVHEALQDGTVTRPESLQLDEAREQLGLSEEEARVMIATEDPGRSETRDRCPHCGMSIAQHRPE